MEVFFFEHADSEAQGFVQFTAGVGAAEQMGGFFTDGAADFAAVGADEFFEVFARLA